MAARKLTHPIAALCIAFIAPLQASAIEAQDPKPLQTATTSPDSTSSKVEEKKKPQVTKVEGVIGIGDELELEVSALDELEAAAAADQKKLGLFLDDTFIPGQKVERSPTNSTHARIYLTRNIDNRGAWAKILGRPWSHKETVALAIGTDDEKVVAMGPTVSVPTTRVSVVFLVVMLVFILLGGLLAWNSEMLRDWVGVDPNDSTKRVLGPFSLGRTQMAFWFLLTFSSFLFLLAVTGSLDTITPQVLALMGISAATGLGSVLVNNAKAATGAQRVSSASFLADILTDDNGFSLHRVQMLFWTVALGAIFVFSVWRDLAMPEFSDTLLALMGISAGAYIGFKLPEKQT
jgi:hypothetical protein